MPPKRVAIGRALAELQKAGIQARWVGYFGDASVKSVITMDVDDQSIKKEEEANDETKRAVQDQTT
jgi:hypothetical protein